MISAHLTIDPHFVVGPINRRLFGSFVEHLGRCVYDGIYEPGHPTADEHGYRSDVIELVRELGVSTIRYPGGNFVSGYRWEDGVGPAERAPPPARSRLALHRDQRGRARRVRDLAEEGRQRADVRRQPRHPRRAGGARRARVREHPLGHRRCPTSASPTAPSEPHDVRMWCLGNEMDGPVAARPRHRAATTPSSRPRPRARCARSIPTWSWSCAAARARRCRRSATWERVVLEETYDDVDFISCHAYYEPLDGDYGSFLASAVEHGPLHRLGRRDRRPRQGGARQRQDDQHLLRRVERLVPVALPTRSTGSPRSTSGRWRLDCSRTSYSVVDAVVFGNLLISLIRHADRVTAASLAQLVNVIAPIMTEPGGPAWRQTTFFPFAVTSRLARGSDARAEARLPDVRDRAVRRSARRRRRRHVRRRERRDRPSSWSTAASTRRSTIDIDVRLLGRRDARRASQSLYDDDIHAANTLQDPERVGLRPNETARLEDGTVTITLPPVSWTALTLA